MKRMFLRLAFSTTILALAACSEADDRGGAEAGFAEEAAVSTTADSASNAEPTAPPLTLALPKMAYVFDYAFRLPGAGIAQLQQKHADLCEAQGPGQCQILSLNRSGEGDEVTGEMQLAVAQEKARAFGTLLSATTETAEGEVLRADITGEELSKVIVDAEARLETRIALRDRLLDVLKTRRGTVEELVEAERSVAQVNEEIDQARSWLKESRGRVAYSRMTVRYEAANPGGAFLAPIEGALGSVSWIAGTIIALLLMIGAAGLPLLLVALGWRKLRARLIPAVSADA